MSRSRARRRSARTTRRRRRWRAARQEAATLLTPPSTLSHRSEHGAITVQGGPRLRTGPLYFSFDIDSIEKPRAKRGVSRYVPGCFLPISAYFEGMFLFFLPPTTPTQVVSSPSPQCYSMKCLSSRDIHVHLPQVPQQAYPYHRAPSSQ